jgi:sulfoxide reductase heme-binding subunit YedZ
LRVAHEALSIAAFALIALHVLSLLADSYFHPSVVDLAIPFERNYREPYMALGIIGGWATILLGLCVYARDRVGAARWKMLHRFTALAWVLTVIHTLGEGSDGGEAWFIAVIVVTALPTTLLILIRLGKARRPSRPRPIPRARVRGSGV